MMLAALTGMSVPDELVECVRQSTLMIWFQADTSRPELWCSRGFLLPLGYEPDAVEPDIRELLARVHTDDLPAVARCLEGLKDTEGGYDFERDFRVRCGDGSYAWVRAWVAVGRREPGEPPSALTILRRIPEERRLERAAPGPQADALHTVMNEVGHPVVLMSATGIVVQSNAAAGLAVGKGAELPVGELCPFLHAPGLPQKAMAAFEAAISTATRQRLELWRFGRWWDMHLVPIPNASGRVEQVLLLAADVSELKELERRRLETERALTVTLVREVHHRIKNHLQGLVGLLRMLQGQGLTADEVIERAIWQVRSIATVHGLLMREPRHALDLDVILRETMKLIEHDRPNGLRFAVDIEPAVTAELRPDDAVAVALIIGELVTNAAKHTPVSPEAFVAVALRGVDASTAEITVRNGPARLPESFSLQARQGVAGGLGLIKACCPRGTRSSSFARTASRWRRGCWSGAARRARTGLTSEDYRPPVTRSTVAVT